MGLTRLPQNVVGRLSGPLSLDEVVWELVQNALDAGASKVTVAIDWQSLSVMVRDNGLGMSAGELQELGKYKTSKIRLLQDLLEVKTYGFKGHALESIKQVSRRYVISRATNGEESNVENDTPDHEIDQGQDHRLDRSYRLDPDGKCVLFDFDDPIMNPLRNKFHLLPFEFSGTIVLVHNLFYNIPVRLKQVHQQGTTRFINHLKRHLVTINRAVDLQVTLDGALVINIPQSACLLLALFRIPSSKVTKVKGYYGHYKITGYLGREFKRGYQFILLNNRVYELPLMYKKHPVFIININCYPQVISELFQDVNKHIWTSKHEPWVRVLVGKLLNRFYLEIIVKSDLFDPVPTSSTPVSSPHKTSLVRRAITTPKKSLNTIEPFKSLTNPFVDQRIESIINRTDLQHIKVIAQVSNKFILVTTGTQLQVLDQHAVDERIKVERFYKRIHENREFSECRIKIPQQHLEILQDYREFLAQVMIILEQEIVAIPRIISRMSDEQIIQGLLVEYTNDIRDHKKFQLAKDWFSDVKNWPDIIIQAINSKACRLAIMFGDKLEMGQMKTLIEQMQQCRMPFQCAHGRPSIVPLVDFN